MRIAKEQTQKECGRGGCVRGTKVQGGEWAGKLTKRRGGSTGSEESREGLGGTRPRLCRGARDEKWEPHSQRHAPLPLLPHPLRRPRPPGKAKLAKPSCQTHMPS